MLYKSLKDTKNTFFPTGWGGLRKSHEEALQYLLMVGVGPVRASVGWRPGSPENGQSLKYMKTYSLKEAKYDVTVKNNGFKSMGLHMFFYAPAIAYLPTVLVICSGCPNCRLWCLGSCLNRSNDTLIRICQDF